MTEKPVQIRRYPNRRLYDRSKRQYVTLDDIEQLVRDGKTIEVQDSRTGDDLTRQLLTQILMERHPDRMELLPLALLHGLLQANDVATEFWRAYLRQALNALEGIQRTLTPLGGPLPWMAPFVPGLSLDQPQISPEVMHQIQELEERIRQLEQANSPTMPSAGSSESDMVERLENRVRELEQQSRKRSRNARK